MNCGSCEHSYQEALEDSLRWCLYYGKYIDPSSVCAWYSCNNYKDREEKEK